MQFIDIMGISFITLDFKILQNSCNLFAKYKSFNRCAYTAAASDSSMHRPFAFNLIITQTQTGYAEE